MIPKKVLRSIEGSFRVFLWTGQTNPSRRALVAWEKVCLPKVSRGWNVIALHTWNKVAVTKLLWALSFKTDKLWVKWVHNYYVKSGSIWNLEIPAQASWALKKIFGCRSIVDASGGWQQLEKK